MNTYMVTLDTYKDGNKTRHIRAESIPDAISKTIEKQNTSPTWDDYWDGEIVGVQEVEWNGFTYVKKGEIAY